MYMYCTCTCMLFIPPPSSLSPCFPLLPCLHSSFSPCLFAILLTFSNPLFFSPLLPPMSLQYYNNTSYIIGGRCYSLNDIESGVLRGNKKAIAALRRPFSSRDDPRYRLTSMHTCRCTCTYRTYMYR